MADDVRYLSELDRFAGRGVDHVIYLQAFGCLKGPCKPVERFTGLGAGIRACPSP